MTTLFGGIEAGGTKFVCAVASSPQDIRLREEFSTTTPAETVDQAVNFLTGRSERMVHWLASGLPHLVRSICAQLHRHMVISPPRPSPVGRISISSARSAGLSPCRSGSIPM